MCVVHTFTCLLHATYFTPAFNISCAKDGTVVIKSASKRKYIMLLSKWIWNKISKWNRIINGLLDNEWPSCKWFCHHYFNLTDHLINELKMKRMKRLQMNY